MRKNSVLFFVLIMAVTWVHAEETGLKLNGSGACIKSCTPYAMNLAVLSGDEHTRRREYYLGSSKETRLSGAQMACAINQVGRTCLDNMRKKRMENVKITNRKNWKNPQPISDYLAIDYIACVYGAYMPQFSVCKYK